MASKLKVTRVLRASFPDVDVAALERVPNTGRLTGVIVSDAFARKDHTRRQSLLWRTLKKGLTPQEVRDLGPIVALTFSEMFARQTDD